MNRFRFSAVLILLSVFTAFAQEDAWIYFSDKPDAAFYLENPLQMLSQKALDRRSAQQISLDNVDVPIHPAYISQIASASGIIVLAQSKWLNAVHVRGSVSDINQLGNLSFVSSIGFANHALNPQGRTASQPSTQRPQSATADFNYGNSANQVEMLNAHLLHQQDFTGSGVTIAVFDTGFPGVDTAAPFARLRDNGHILGTHDFVHDLENAYSGASHGTSVLSALGGFADGQLVGTAPDADYYLFATEDVLSENPVEESYWAEAAEVADSLGVDIISSSLGYRNYDNPDYTYTFEHLDGQTSFITRAAEIAFSKGIIVINAAGNSGGNTASPWILAPSDGAHVLAIGSVDASENYSPFSSVGPTADGRIKPDLAAKGSGTFVSDASGGINSGNGTSYATPVLAGAVACLWQALPDLTNQEIVDLVKSSSDQYSNPDYLKGYGVPDFSLALESALSVQGHQEEKVFVYPNPVSDRFYLSDASVATTSFWLSDAAGRLVLKGISEASGNDVSGLRSGVYFYELVREGKTIRGKLIKN